MNRSQRRKLNLTQEQGKLMEELINMSKVKKVLDNWKPIAEGTKVKINVERIKTHPDYDRLTDKYKNWIGLHKNDIFTVEYDEKFKVDPTLLCLKEDENPAKWLFHESDLIVIKDGE